MRKSTAKLLRDFSREAFQAEKDARPDGKTVSPSHEATYEELKSRWQTLGERERLILASEMRRFLEMRRERAKIFNILDLPKEP